ncbi:hypothetical protein Tco_1400786 [Tanacetum coccineum]
MKQVDQYAKALTSILAIMDCYIKNKLGEVINKAIQAHNLDCRQEAQDEKNEYIGLVDTSMRTIIKEENVADSLKADVLTRSSSQPQSMYKAASALIEFELTKILIDKMEKNKSFDKADHKRELYKALVTSYETDKDLFDTYGEVFSLKRDRDDKDKDQDPFAGSDRGSKRRKSSKDVESSRDSMSKEKKSSRVQQDQEFVTGDNDEQPADKEVTKADSQATRVEEPQTSFNELMDTSFDFSAFVLNRLNITNLTQEILVGPSTVIVTYDKHAYLGISHWGPKRQRFYGYASNLTSSKDVYSRRRIIAVTRLTIEKKYDYGHLEEIEVRRDDQLLYTFKEGDFPRLRLQDIEDMLLLLVQQKLTNLTIDERYDLNVALHLRNRTAYTSYSDPQGVIYMDNFDRKRLMCVDELHKFSDGTLNDIRSALHDITKGIRMEYLSKRKWSGLDKKRPRVMVQDIDKQLFERRLIRNLEKFVGGREYKNDLKLMERTI